MIPRHYLEEDATAVEIPWVLLSEHHRGGDETYGIACWWTCPVLSPWIPTYVFLDHCFEMLRQAAVCHADLSLTTFKWDKTKTKPMFDVSEVVHECIDWEALRSSISYRYVDDHEIDRLNNPLQNRSVWSMMFIKFIPLLVACVRMRAMDMAFLAIQIPVIWLLLTVGLPFSGEVFTLVSGPKSGHIIDLLVFHFHGRVRIAHQTRSQEIYTMTDMKRWRYHW